MKPELNPTEARQGRRLGVVHKILIISLSLAVIGMVAAAFIV